MEEKRAKRIAKLAADLGDGDSLLTPEVLVSLGFGLLKNASPAASAMDVGEEVPGSAPHKVSGGVPESRVLGCTEAISGLHFFIVVLYSISLSCFYFIDLCY